MTVQSFEHNLKCRRKMVFSIHTRIYNKAFMKESVKLLNRDIEKAEFGGEY